MLENVIAYAKICGIYVNFWICNSENAIMCGKICNRIFAYNWVKKQYFVGSGFPR